MSGLSASAVVTAVEAVEQALHEIAVLVVEALAVAQQDRRIVRELVGEAVGEHLQDLLGAVAVMEVAQGARELGFGKKVRSVAKRLNEGDGLALAEPFGEVAHAQADDGFGLGDGGLSACHALVDHLAEVVDGVDVHVVETIDLGLDVTGNGKVDDEHRTVLAFIDGALDHAQTDDRQGGGRAGDDDVVAGNLLGQVGKTDGVGVHGACENLTALEKKSGCGRVIIEYNGMWLIQELYDALPDNWLIYQSLATADGTTIKTYAGDSAMRSLLLDKLRGSELLVVNRAEAVNDDESRQLIHKLVRQASRRCDIAYEFKDGSVAYDDIPDPLPFDVDAPVIEIPEEFFGIWYMDCMDDPKKYDGKTVKYLAQVCQTPQAGKGAFVPGRFAMTCCVQDIQFVGMPCKYDDYKSLEQRSWINITAKVNVKYHPIYKGQTPDSTGPVLTAISVEPGEKPAQDVVMFS